MDGLTEGRVESMSCVLFQQRKISADLCKSNIDLL